MFVSAWQTPSVRQYVIVFFANLSVLGLGLNIAWTSPVLVKLRHPTESALGRPITDDEGAWIVSVSSIIAIVVNLLGVFIVDRLGRKVWLFVGSVPKILCYVILLFANQFWMIIVARVLGGLSDALTFLVVPIYVSEIASNEVRGSLGTMLQMFASLGTVIMLCMGPFLNYFTLNITVLAMVVATSLPLLLLPESPYFLNKNGKKSEALKVLTHLRGTEATANEEIKAYDSEIVEMITASEVFKSRTIMRGIATGIIIGIGTQLTGFNAVSFNLQSIFESTGTSVSSEISSVIIGVIQFSASLCTTFFIDKIKRKPIIIYSLFGLAVGLICLGTFFTLTGDGEEIIGFLNFLPLASLVVIVWCYSGGLGCILWPLISELFDGRSRGLGVSATLFFNTAALSLLTRFFPAANNAFGPSVTYYFFSCCTLALIVFFIFFVPETKGKSFAEIQAALGGKNQSKDSQDKEISIENTQNRQSDL